ncbi:hypothetical protein DFAR_2870025 [Desulfarculales bacterium]
MPGTTRSMVKGRGSCGTSAPSGGKSPSPTAPGGRVPPFWDGFRLYRQGGGKRESRYPMSRNDRGGSRALDEGGHRPGPVRLRRELPTASVTTLISEIMHRRLTLLDVILKAPTVLPLTAPAEADGQTGRPHLSTAGASRPSCPTTFGRVTPCMGQCSWWAANGARPISSPSSLHRRQEPPDRPCRVLPLRGPSHLSTGLAPDPAQAGATTQDLPRPRPSRPLPPPGKDHRLPGHRPGPLTALRAPEQGQGRKILPHCQVPISPRLQG